MIKAEDVPDDDDGETLISMKMMLWNSCTNNADWDSTYLLRHFNFSGTSFRAFFKLSLFRSDSKNSA